MEGNQVMTAKQAYPSLVMDHIEDVMTAIRATHAVIDELSKKTELYQNDNVTRAEKESQLSDQPAHPSPVIEKLVQVRNEVQSLEERIQHVKDRIVV